MVKEQIRTKVEAVMAEKKIAGLSVAITDREKILFAEGFGVESVERPEVSNEAGAIYRIASITKVITSIIILRLAEQGKLTLDSLVKQYVPWLKLSNPEAEQQLTIRHLLTHTGGFRTEGYLQEGSRDESSIENALRQALPLTPMDTLPADRVYQYSNIAYDLLGHIASVVTGKPISQLASELVLTPLGMDRTTFDFYVAATYPLSFPHAHDKTGNLKVVHRQRANTMFSACGGLYSNAFDLCKLARFFLNEGEQLLRRESFADMTSKHMANRTRLGDFYGLGVQLHKYTDRYLLGHTGNYDPYNTCVFADPKTGYGVAVLINTDAVGVPLSIAEMIFDLLGEK